MITELIRRVDDAGKLLARLWYGDNGSPTTMQNGLMGRIVN